MAALTFEMPTDIMNKLDQLGNSAEYAPKMLEAEEDVVFSEVIRRVSVHSNGEKKSTGALRESIKKTKPKLDKNGVWRAQIIPTGRDKKGVSNNEKLLSLEYGTSKQLATPVLRPAKESKASEAQEAAQNIFNEAVSK